MHVKCTERVLRASGTMKCMNQRANADAVSTSLSWTGEVSIYSILQFASACDSRDDIAFIVTTVRNFKLLSSSIPT